MPGDLFDSAMLGWAMVVAFGLPATAKIVIVWLALRGAGPADRPKILSAVAELFRRGSRQPPDTKDHANRPIERRRNVANSKDLSAAAEY